MRTRKWLANDNLIEAIEQLKGGEVVAFPTETVYGLGANARNEKAIEKIYKAKGRPSDNPLIVHFASWKQIEPYVTDVPDYVSQLMDAFSPGPITFVLKSTGKVAPSVTAGLPTVGVRIPDHPVALRLLEHCPFPLAAPSANLSGKPSPTLAQHVIDDLEGKIAGVIDGGNAKTGLESTVLDCTGPSPVILRPGTITAKDIEKVLTGQMIDTTSQEQVDSPISPGTKYKHYAPEVPLYLFIGKDQTFIREKLKSRHIGRLGFLQLDQKATLEVEKTYELGQSNQEVAKRLYDVLRHVSKTDVDAVYCVLEGEDALSEAIVDRLKRAATYLYVED
ncbi:MAG TPA: L-threonylcarbamoyladenylate synthase [Pseudogracilibacillus sp.]|nr:L-threonylcarbamoyladenylate synthase [Pseudogracilibacillus sp.]